MSEKIVEIKFEMSEARHKKLQSLMKDVGSASSQDFFNLALTHIEWAIEVSKKGLYIASINKEATSYAPVLSPEFLFARIRGQT